VLAVGSIDGEHYYVYEYMAASLRQEIEQQKRLSWRNCLRSLLRKAEAIDHLHRRGFGMDMALACDIRVMAQTAKLAPTPVKRGIVPM
jgi:hypothetical protein